MVIITDITVPAEQFALGRLFKEYPDIVIELERIVPIDSAVIPLIWFEGIDRDDIEENLRSDPLTNDVKFLTETEDRYLFKLAWDADIDHVIQPLIQNDAEILQGEGTVDKWEFRLQFRQREDLVGFRQAALDNGVQIELQRLFNPRLSEEDCVLTDAQKDAILTAYENGYWNVPRDSALGNSPPSSVSATMPLHSEYDAASRRSSPRRSFPCSEPP